MARKEFSHFHAPFKLFTVSLLLFLTLYAKISSKAYVRVI